MTHQGHEPVTLKLQDKQSNGGEMMGQEQHSKSTGKWEQLSEKERYQIEILQREKRTASEIAKRLGRDRRTIEREIARGSVVQLDSELREHLRYCADVGQ